MRKFTWSQFSGKTPWLVFKTREYIDLQIEKSISSLLQVELRVYTRILSNHPLELTIVCFEKTFSKHASYMSRPHPPRVEIPLTVDWNRDRGVCLLNDWGFMGSWARHIYLEDLSTQEERECWEKCKTPTPYPLLIGSFTKFPCKSKINLFKGCNVSNLVKKRIQLACC